MSWNSFDPVSIEDVIDLVNGNLSLMNCYCLTKAGYHALEDFDVTISFIVGQTLCTHLYKIEPLPGLETCVFWMTYKICCEILVRLGMDFLIDGQISSFCPGQHEAALLTLIISHKLTQSL